MVMSLEGVCGTGRSIDLVVLGSSWVGVEDVREEGGRTRHSRVGDPDLGINVCYE